MDSEHNRTVDRLLPGVSMLLISSIGFFLNVLIFRKFAHRKQLSNGFFVLCFSKSISNSVICLINLCWIGTAILVGNLFLPITVNEFLGQLNEYGIYIMGPLTQILMAIDRFLIIFFPLRVSDRTRCAISRRAIAVCWVASAFFVAYSYRGDCWVFFTLETPNYDAHNLPCDDINLDALLLVCFVLAIVSSTMQLSTLMRLLFLHSKRKTNQSSPNRRRRTMRLFAQSVVQDCLHCLDMLNSRNLFALKSVIGHFFIFTFSLVFVHAPDGFIMCLFHLERPCANKNKSSITKTIRINSALNIRSCTLK